MACEDINKPHSTFIVGVIDWLTF